MKEVVMPTPQGLSENLEEGLLGHSLPKASITLTPTPEKDNAGGDDHTSTSTIKRRRTYPE